MLHFFLFHRVPVPEILLPKAKMLDIQKPATWTEISILAT